MTNPTLQLDPIALREATAQAIMGVLSPELREAMIRESISSLLRVPDGGRYSEQRSPLQRAFDDAILVVAREIAHEEIAKSEEFMAQLRALTRRTASKVLNQDEEKLATKMANAFVSSMTRD